MTAIRVLVDSFADEGLINAQMGNAREIVRRIDPDRFHVSMFACNPADPAITTRPNTRIVRLPKKRQTVPILREFVFGGHNIIFYLKPSPASKWYLRTRGSRSTSLTVGTIESQSDLGNEPTISPEFINLWERTVLRCDHLFSNSRAVKESLIANYGLDSEIISTGVDTSFFTPSDRLANSRLRVLFVGSLRPFKQPDTLLDAAAIIRDADFVIVGDGPMKESLLDRIRRENLTNVRLTGSLRIAGLREEYRKSDVFLFPSQWEGSPKVILEAAACGLPVIARNRYQPETVLQGQTGFLVNNNEELIARLRDLLRSEDLRRKFGSAGRAHARRYDWDVITRQWEQAFIRMSNPRRQVA